MDKFHKMNSADMTAWDISCYCVRMNENRRKLKKKFRKLARKRLTKATEYDIMNTSKENE